MENLKLTGKYFITKTENGVTEEFEVKNLITNEGLGAILKTLGQLNLYSFYIVPTSTVYTASPTDTLSTLLTNAVEITAYSQTTRPAWQVAVTGTQIDNSSNLATYTFTGSGTVNGFIVCSNSTKGSTSGIALSYVSLGTGISFSSTASLAVKYQINAASA